jgi:predicted nucleotidyltransferase
MDNKEQHIMDLIRKKIFQKNPGAEVILFGSHARGDSHADSDWDILILLSGFDVSRKVEMEYREEMFEVELEIGEPISTFVFSKTDWETKHSITPLYQNIKTEGISLI